MIPAVSTVVILIQNREKKEEENNMDPSLANDIINFYAAERGYPTFEGINAMSRADFEKGLALWPTEYIEAMPDAAMHYALTGKVKHPQTGQMVRSEWGWRIEQIQKTVEFRYTTEGKKYVLSLLDTNPVRNEETDVDDMINTASIKVAADTGSAKKDKKQTQINIKRMEHIKALEKSISKGGALRAMYESTLKVHKESVDNLMLNEEAAKAAMKDKRRKKIPALLLSWIVMPLYVILRTLDMFFDGYFSSMRMGYTEVALGPKVGSNHRLLGRISIPFVVSAFISFVSATINYNLGVEDNVKYGIFITGVAAIPLYMLGFTILKQLLDIPFMWLTNKYGEFASKVSSMFEPTTADEFQFGKVTQTYEQQEILGQLIKEREELIKGLKEAVERNTSYSHYDTKCKDKKFSLKMLEKEHRDTFGY